MAPGSALSSRSSTAPAATSTRCGTGWPRHQQPLVADRCSQASGLVGERIQRSPTVIGAPFGYGDVARV